MTSTHPVRADGLEMYETEDGVVVYHRSTDRVHHLNPTAAVILELSDGSRNLAAIARAVQDLFGLAAPPTGQTTECLEDLRREQLVS